jgi:hypothetical protein
MRRAFAISLLALAVLGATGCAGADAERAQAILAQSQQAMNDVQSFRFSMRLWTSDAPQDFSMTMRGGGYATGKRAGDFFLTASVEGMPSLGSFSLVSRRGAAHMNLGSGWVRMPVPTASAQAAGPLAGFDFTPYIKAVSVTEGGLVDGEPTTKIAGVIDTDALLRGALSQLSGMGGGGLDFSKAFGDIRAVLYVSDRTHLVRRGLADFSIEAFGERVEMHMDFALDGVNEPVKIPNPA